MRRRGRRKKNKKTTGKLEDGLPFFCFEKRRRIDCNGYAIVNKVRIDDFVIFNKYI